LSAKEYTELMRDKTDEVPKSRLKALEELEKEKIKIAKAYNKCVMEKSFQFGDLVSKMILPLGTQLFHTYDQKCSQITKCHNIEYNYYINNVFKD
jgi:hypothetical protein